MSGHWLEIIGIGEDGVAGLSHTARSLVENAEVIIGGMRHHCLLPGLKAERIAWPSPFDAMIDKIKSCRGRRIVILVTGDPLWYSVGARITKAIPPEEIRFHPQLSAFQLAACRLGWSLADVETLTIHGRPAEQILPYVAPSVRMLVLTKDGGSPSTVARLLLERGYGASRLIVLAALGGPHEERMEGTAQEWLTRQAPDFHVLAIDCVAGEDAQILPRTGLPDGMFEHDGKITKQAVRALTLAKLVPCRGALLWDIGAGCGSVSIEWMRAAPEARAIAIEPNEVRRAMAERNAVKLGAPALKLVDGKAPEALGGLPRPDAIFIGGGLAASLAEFCLNALKPFGRLVANAVTLESEQVLTNCHALHGGELVRLQAQSAGPLGPWRGWKPAMPVTQWSIARGAQ